MTDTAIRPMDQADITTVVAMEARAHAFPWTAKLFGDSLSAGYNCFVLEAQGQVVGYGILQMVLDEAHLLNITVDPDRQGKGLGRLLLNGLIDVARTRAISLFLEVRPSNTRAIGLYLAMGFNEIGSRRNYYPTADGRREDALMMALAL